jgi:hypothetical protein
MDQPEPVHRWLPLAPNQNTILNYPYIHIHLKNNFKTYLQKLNYERF